MSGLYHAIRFDLTRPGFLRGWVRGSEFALIVMAVLIGVLTGCIVAAMGLTVQAMHEVLFRIGHGTRLSEAVTLSSWTLGLVPAAGGLLLGMVVLVTGWFRRRPTIDPIEANALHGGRMALGDAGIVIVQNIISTGFGTSVGLEAGYTQIAGACASRLGGLFDMRRNEMRLLVGCGAAAAIAAAFNAPFTGAFYAVELIIGSYSLTALAPLMAAALSGAGMARVLIGKTTFFDASLGALAVHPQNYAPAILLGCLAAAFGIAIMQSVTLIEKSLRRSGLPMLVRLPLGGLVVGALALVSPQVLSSGHGALHLDIAMTPSIATLAALILMKSAASIVSLGSGFRGGLFFASLLLGALLGDLFSFGLAAFGETVTPQPILYAIIGMSSLGVTIVGGPLTMTFLALEASRDFEVTSLALVAVLTASLITRKTFGYSFATWRFHLRGESIRGAYDIGWINALTVRSLMRSDVRTAPEGMMLSSFRASFPLGSTQRVVVVDERHRYKGIVSVADAHSADNDDTAATTAVGAIVKLATDMLLPDMNAKEAAHIFEESASEALAVVSSLAEPRVIGFLTESYTLRRYSEELDKRRGELTGEG